LSATAGLAPADAASPDALLARALREDLRLTVGEPGGSLQTREVRLAAGTTTTETIEF
jgi:hypothetical protein